MQVIVIASDTSNIYEYYNIYYPIVNRYKVKDLLTLKEQICQI